MFDWSPIKIFSVSIYSIANLFLVLIYFDFIDARVAIYFLPISSIFYIYLGVYFMENKKYKVAIIFSKNPYRKEGLFTTVMRAFLFPTLFVFFDEYNYYYSAGGVLAAVFFISMAALLLYHLIYIYRTLEF